MFAIVGALATLVIAGLLSPWRAWRKAFALTLAAAGALFLVNVSGTVTTRGDDLWWQQPIWRNLLLYTFMFTGMMFRVIWDQLEARRAHNAQPGVKKRRRPQFDFWDFVYPVMPSLALFQAVLWLAGENQLNPQLCLASFQNGFFWHSLLARTALEVEKGSSAKA